MHMGFCRASAAGSRRHQRRKEAFPSPPTDRRRIFSGRRPHGRNGFQNGVQGETSERTRKAARPPFRLAESSENSPPRRLAGTEIRVSPPFREASAPGFWFPQRRFRKPGRQRSVLAGILRFPARRTAADRVCRPTVPETVTPCMHLEKLRAEIEKNPDGRASRPRSGGAVADPADALRRRRRPRGDPLRPAR